MVRGDNPAGERLLAERGVVAEAALAAPPLAAPEAGGHAVAARRAHLAIPRLTPGRGRVWGWCLRAGCAGLARRAGMLGRRVAAAWSPGSLQPARRHPLSLVAVGRVGGGVGVAGAGAAVGHRAGLRAVAALMGRVPHRQQARLAAVADLLAAVLVLAVCATWGAAVTRASPPVGAVAGAAAGHGAWQGRAGGSCAPAHAQLE